MSTQPPVNLEDVASSLSVREIPFSSRMGKQKRNSLGQPVRRVTTQIKKEEILRLLLINYTTRMIADDLKLHVGTVRDYIRDEEFQKELRAISEPIWRRVDEELCFSKLKKTQRLEAMGDRALEVIKDLLESGDEKVALKAASDVLDRSPETSKHQHIDSRTVNFNISAEDLMHAATAAAEIARTEGS